MDIKGPTMNQILLMFYHIGNISFVLKCGFLYNESVEV